MSLNHGGREESFYFYKKLLCRCDKFTFLYISSFPPFVSGLVYSYTTLILINGLAGGGGGSLTTDLAAGWLAGRLVDQKNR